MCKITGRAGVLIWTLMYTMHFLMLGAIIILSVTGPQNNLFPWQMAVGTVLGTALLFGFFWLWERIPGEKLKRSTLLYTILLILFGAMLYAVSCICRNSPYSLDDYIQIWNGASELAGGRELTSVFYFQTYANNIKPMLFLSLLFRLAGFLGFQDPFYFVLLWSTGQVLTAVWSVSVLAGSSKADRERYRISVLFC